MSKIDGTGLSRLRGLCNLALDERTPEKERTTAAFALCREVKKLLFADGPVPAAPAPTAPPPAETVQVVHHEGRVYFHKQQGQPFVEPEGEPEWEEMDDGEDMGFGKGPRTRPINVFGDQDDATINRKRRRR